jgi:hypothetical protein
LLNLAVRLRHLQTMLLLRLLLPVLLLNRTHATLLLLLLLRLQLQWLLLPLRLLQAGSRTSIPGCI